MTNNKFAKYFLDKYIYNINDYKVDEHPEFIVNMDNVNVSFKNKAGIIHAVRDVSIKVRRGQIIGIVGESGSGKSVTVKSLIGFNGKCITKADALQFKNFDLSKVNNERIWKHVRGSKIAYIPQDPLLSLNPTKRIGEQVIESILISKKRKLQQKILDLKQDFKLKTSNSNLSSSEKTKLKQEFVNAKKQLVNDYKQSIQRKNVKKELFGVLDYIGIKNIPERIKDFPHEFSGGMRQRIVIAMAIVSEPDLIIADEPTTALDVTIQAKVLDLIKKLRDELNITVILISHNIGLVANFCDFIYVMYAGKIVEQGLIKEIFTNPRHPYTWALICSIPDSSSTQQLESIPGTPPNLIIPPIGDAFAPRNKYALEIDFEKQPPMFPVGNSLTHKAATWLLHENSPMKNIPSEVLEKLVHAKKSLELKEKNNQLKNDKKG